MAKLLTNGVSEKMIAGSIFSIFIISLIPLFYLSQYIHPTTDDYVFGANPYHVWMQTHSFLQTIQAAIEVSSRIYTDWQGTYSACFLMALQPGIFDAYWITPFILIPSFIFGTYWLSYLLLCQFLNANRWQYLIISTTLILMCMQSIPSPFDAFYWYNGGLYYTFYYAMCLILAGSLIKCCTAQKTITKVSWGTLSLLLCLFIAGGNYVTGLFVPVLLAFSILLFLIKKKKVPSILYASLCIFIIAFLFSMLAPGNDIRAAHEKEGVSALEAIWLSFTYGCNYIAKFTNPTLSALFIFLSPILYRLAKQTKLKFSRPWLFALITYALYCVLFTPTCYAFGFPGFERNLNLYMYSYCWLVLGNLFYILGAIWQNSQKGNTICSDLTNLASHIKKTIMPYHPYIYLVTISLFSVTILQTSASSKKVLRDITSGRAATFNKEMKDRVARYKSNEKQLALPRLTQMPESTIAFDISFDSGYWINQGVCLYYGKESVALDTPMTNREKDLAKVQLSKEVGPGNLRYKNK